MREAEVEWVATEGRAIRGEAQMLLPEVGPLTAVARLRSRHPEVAPALISAACSVASAALSHADKLSQADTLVLTDTLAQQATHWAVSAYRAQRLLSRGVHSVIDATAGGGLDARACVEAGLSVTAIERDAVAFACARANLPAEVHVILGDATTIAPRLLELQPKSAVFVDPARRDASGPRRGDGGRAHAERDPERWSPPWSWVCNIAASRATVAKVAPGIPLAVIPAESTVEWIAIESDVVEACVWFAPLNDAASRRATVIVPGRPVESLDDRALDGPVDTRAIGEFLIEPHSAVRRAGLVDNLAARLGCARVSARSTWLTGGKSDTSLARWWRVTSLVDVADLPGALRDYAKVSFKTQDIDRSAESVATSVKHRARRDADGHAWVVMMRDLPVAAIVRPA